MSLDLANTGMLRIATDEFERKATYQRKTAYKIEPECFTCPLPECCDESPHCPIRQSKRSQRGKR